MTELAFAIAIQALWQDWSRAYVVLQQSPKKERATKKWFVNNPRVIDRALAQQPYNFI